MLYVPSYSTSNFWALSRYEREGWVQIDEYRYWAPGQAWPTQIEMKFLADLAAEKIAFLWEVFLRFGYSNQVVLKASITLLYNKQVQGDVLTHTIIKLVYQQVLGRVDKEAGLKKKYAIKIDIKLLGSKIRKSWQFQITKWTGKKDY